MVEGRVESSPALCLPQAPALRPSTRRAPGGGGRAAGPGTLEPTTADLLLLPPQVVYYSEMHKIFGDLTQQLAQPGRPDEQRERENEARLSELRALSIVADD